MTINTVEDLVALLNQERVTVRTLSGVEMEFVITMVRDATEHYPDSVAIKRVRIKAISVSPPRIVRS